MTWQIGITPRQAEIISRDQATARNIEHGRKELLDKETTQFDQAKKLALNRKAAHATRALKTESRRAAIMVYLRTVDEARPVDAEAVAEACSGYQSTIWHDLRVMRNLGVVKYGKIGKVWFYWGRV